MSELQTKACKHCGYEEYEHGSTIASWHVVELISKEPIKKFKCISCGKKMQLYYQSSHRRFYKCWDCGMIDADSIIYENEQKGFP